MQLRHISPRSIDWMDAMDEGSGGRGWEKLGPEERAKLLRSRQGEREASAGVWAATTDRRPPRVAGYFASASASK
jgi:hypothetical protein